MAAIKAYSIAGFSIFNKSSSVVQDSHYLILSYRFRQTYMYTKECSVLVGREFKKKALIPMQNARRYSNLMALSDALSTISFKRGLVNKAVIAFWLAEAHATSYRVSELKF